MLLHLCKLANNYLYLNVSFREKETIMFSTDLKNIYICAPFCNIEEVIIFSILLIGKPFHILVWLLLLKEKLQFEENLFPELQLLYWVTLHNILYYNLLFCYILEKGSIFLLYI